MLLRLTIETTNVILDKAHVSDHPDVGAAPDVTLTVSDTGHATSGTVIKRIFGPFFTTKPTGQGAGPDL